MNFLRAVLVGCCILAGTSGANAAICAASATPLSFGNYNQFARAPTDITATISVTCIATAAETVAYKIEIGPGSSGSFTHRRLHNGSALLAYQLYTSAEMSQVWGDGTGGTGTVSDSYRLSAGSSRTDSYRLYGVISASQHVVSGSYTDPIMVILSN